jgi:hypothetical protein
VSENPISPVAKGIVEALVAAGHMRKDAAAAATAIVNQRIPKAVSSFSFSADAEFLQSCMKHHVGTYFKQVLEPMAKAHHVQGRAGRMMVDKDISEAAVEITTLVISEIGPEYVKHMSKYFGSKASLAEFVYSRVHASLIETASSYNEAYLNSMAKKNRYQTHIQPVRQVQPVRQNRQVPKPQEPPEEPTESSEPAEEDD